MHRALCLVSDFIYAQLKLLYEMCTNTRYYPLLDTSWCTWIDENAHVFLFITLLFIYLFSEENVLLFYASLLSTVVVQAISKLELSIWLNSIN